MYWNDEFHPIVLHTNSSRACCVSPHLCCDMYLLSDIKTIANTSQRHQHAENFWHDGATCSRFCHIHVTTWMRGVKGDRLRLDLYVTLRDKIRNSNTCVNQALDYRLWECCLKVLLQQTTTASISSVIGDHNVAHSSQVSTRMAPISTHHTGQKTFITLWE